MTTRLLRFLQTPRRMSRGLAIAIGVLAGIVLVFAATGLFHYEGWPSFVQVSALALVGLTNLALALGSLLPEERGGKALRTAVVPLSLLMLVTLLASLILFDDVDKNDVIAFAVIVGLSVAVSIYLQRRKLQREQVRTKP